MGYNKYQTNYKILRPRFNNHYIMWCNKMCLCETSWVICLHVHTHSMLIPLSSFPLNLLCFCLHVHAHQPLYADTTLKFSFELTMFLFTRSCASTIVCWYHSQVFLWTHYVSVYMIHLLGWFWSQLLHSSNNLVPRMLTTSSFII